jgi:hypothetical protein
MASRAESWQKTVGCTATGDTTVIAANANGSHHVRKIVVTVYAYSATGTIALTDGTTSFFLWQPSTGNGCHFEVTFPEEYTFNWGTNKAITLTCGTANVSARVVVLGYTSY